MRGLPSRGQRAVVLLLLAVLFAGVIAHQGFAADDGKTIMLGESLSDAERQELLDFFGANGDDRVETVTVSETQDAMEGIINRSFSTAYSSTSLQCRELGDGLEVKTRNITIITPSLYAMALVTAGLGDGELLVAAPNGAPAEGLTALTGVFKTWDIAPCDSGSTTQERQRLALEQLALAVEIGQALGTPTGVADAGNLVLYLQQAVVIDGLTKAGEISDAIANQEAIAGISIPQDQRDRLIDLMVRLADADIDWSTFSAGWTIKPTDDGTGISMKGDGVAIRDAQASATARAADEMTATANAAAEMTATAEAESAMMTATASAELDAQTAADAKATEDALAAAMTATAAAMPTQTPMPTPEPTATPAPIGMSGTITDIKGSQILIDPSDGGDATAVTVPADASITRGGESASLSALEEGDKVTIVIDGTTRTVREPSATAAAPGLASRFSKFVFLLPALAAIPLILFLKGRDGVGDPFIVKRVASA
jgi:uncharacterized protein YpuA (DUF1002 family)